MLRTRIIPCLLLEDDALVKTVKFKKPNYIGDPINSVRIYNELGVDELVFLDIAATEQNSGPSYKMIEDIASECFMPFSYGGGIRTLKDAGRLFDIGVEKVSLNTAVYENPDLITAISDDYGRQSVIVSIDVKKNFFGKYQVRVKRGRKSTKQDVVEYAKKAEEYGAGEILVNNIDREGTMEGFDEQLISMLSDNLSVPVIAFGGAGEMNDILKAKNAGASAVGLGSMAVYQNKNRGILINFPPEDRLKKLLNEE